MGCGPSQNQVEPSIVSKDPNAKESNAKAKTPATKKTVEKEAPKRIIITNKAVAFEIPADGLRANEINEGKALDSDKGSKVGASQVPSIITRNWPQNYLPSNHANLQRN